MRILYITTIGPTMGFFKSLICDLIESGNTVDIAANVSESDVPEYYRTWGCNVYTISCTRHPLDKGNLKAIKQIRQAVVKGKYDIVHCHTPIAAACTRIACRKLRKTGLKVMYTAHGFHFFKGAPLKNWLLYYPVEWLFAFWTDALITINKEDFARARKHMHAMRVEYVPGVGIDLQKFALSAPAKERNIELRSKLGMNENDKLILSVGELNANKNHEAVIRTLANISDKSIHYAIAGTGNLHDYLENIAKELGLSERVHLLGFRADVADLYRAADLYVHPSFREGLPVALMEAIASKTAVICSDIRGNVDLVNEDATFKPNDISGIKEKIEEYLATDMTRRIEDYYLMLQKYDVNHVIICMKEIYSS